MCKLRAQASCQTKAFGTQPALALSLAVFTSVPKSPNSNWGAFRRLDAALERGLDGRVFPLFFFSTQNPC